jgi:hypothetical protein
VGIDRCEKLGYVTATSWSLGHQGLELYSPPVGDAFIAAAIAMAAPASPFEPPTLAHRILASPLHLLLSAIHTLLNRLRGAAYVLPPSPIRLVLISDTHDQTLPLPSGDILIHGGDLTNSGSAASIQAQIDWLAATPHAHVIAIAGNHDSYLDSRSRAASDADQTLRWGRVTYLQHDSCVVEVRRPGHGGGARPLKIFGAPQIPACGGPEMAFQYPRGQDAWSGTVPRDTDVLVTHTPPKWHRDLPRGMGCEWLAREVRRVRPRVHVFGHVHAGRGREDIWWDAGQEAWERVCQRVCARDAGGKGGWWGWWGIGVWIDTWRVIANGLSGVLWARVWGAEGEGTIMVNAAVVNWRMGKAVFRAQVVEI